MKNLTILGVVLVLMSMVACSSKPKPLVPLALVDAGAKSQAVTLTEQGTQAYQAKQFEDARRYFEEAVTAAPQSGQAHYNYALALKALGDSASARDHFFEAANLAPEDKTIWDSPVLAPYGEAKCKTCTKDRPYGTERPFKFPGQKPGSRKSF